MSLTDLMVCGAVLVGCVALALTVVRIVCPAAAAAALPAGPRSCRVAPFSKRGVLAERGRPPRGRGDLMSGIVSHAGRRCRALAVAAAAVLFVVAVQSGAAGTTALFTGAGANAACTTSYPGVSGPDLLSPCQWDMQAIGAVGAHDTATGEGVRVGVIDGGIDFTHPDLAGAIDVGASCSFIFSTTPTADPQEVANGDCSNKAAVQDLQGHGTHVATTIAARQNGFGIVGVAPEATVVGLKACTIVGYCFADSVAAALRYAGDQRLDVVNLSLFADPYLYYCANEAGQRAIFQDLQAAARYAEQRGVVIVAAASSWLTTSTVVPCSRASSAINP